MSVKEVHYDTVTEARAHFSALIDAAEAGVPATVQRDKRRAAVVDADRLRQLSGHRTPSGGRGRCRSRRLEHHAARTSHRR